MTALTERRRAATAARKRQHLIIWIAFAAVLLLLPLLSTKFGLTVLTQICIAATFALSYNMLLGQGGMLSFGHAVYFGLGGYLSMHMMNYIAGGWPVPIVLMPLFGGLFGLLIAWIFGSFSTYRAGTVFALISLGIAELVAASALILVGFFGGEEGVTANRTRGPEFFGYNLAQQIEVYYLAAVWFLVATYFMYKFSRTPAGRMANAVRDNPERTEFIGYSQRNVRYVSFMASGFFAGLAGGIFAIQYEIVTEATVNLVASGQVLLQAYIGGIGFFVGPIIGAVILTVLSTVVSGATELWLLYAGLLFVGTVLFLPMGLTSLFMMHVPAFRSGRLGRLAGPYLMMAVPVLMMFFGFVGLLEMLDYVRGAGVGDSEMSLFYVTFDTENWIPWLIFGALAILGVFGFRYVKPLLAEAWDEANAPLAPAEQPAATPPEPEPTGKSGGKKRTRKKASSRREATA